MTSASDVRVGDRERSAAADRLAAHAAAGRLTVEELEARVERAHAAVLRRDLDSLLADLPAPGRRAVTPRAPALPLLFGAALAATVALSLVAGHPVPPVFLLFLIAWRRFA
jgi:fatty acid desaturase